MKLIIVFFLSIILGISSLTAQVKTAYFDGPYIFHQNENLRIQWIERGVGHDTLIAKNEAGKFVREGLPEVDLNDLDFDKNKQATFDNIENIVAISDAHGQYDLMINLLKANRVIDEQNQWIFGKGHLVITGDNLDRGDKVMEILWFLFFLEKQAAKAGGKVHVLLGNHEVMVLQGDIRYLNRKYLYTSGILKNRYHLMFAEGSILGDWIANHKVMTSINRSLFLHGGISEEILKLDFSLEKMNEIFTQHLVRFKDKSVLKNPKLSTLYEENGPLWYRGYFKKEEMQNFPIDKILKKLNQDRIIVGHTSFDSIRSFYGGKVLGIDCSIKVGKTGEVLIYENKKFFVGEMDGTKRSITFNPTVKPNKSSFCGYLFQIEGIPKIVFNTDVKRLLRKSFKEEYQEATLMIKAPNKEKFNTFQGRIRARGNTRKKVCTIPPVKFDFSKKVLDSLGLLKNDKLKFVFPCQMNSRAQERLYKEFFLYELYHLIDSNSIKVKLMEVEFWAGEEEKIKFYGFLIEDEEEYARRKNAIVVEKGKLNASRLHRSSFLKMLFFQYMISNTDWAIANRHNIELVKLPALDKVVALPYDFDYAGFVGQEYAVPHESLPIKDVHERHFFNHKMRRYEFYDMVRFYESIEEEVYRICDTATYMKPKTIKENKAYLKNFFDLLKRPESLERDILKR